MTISLFTEINVKIKIHFLKTKLNSAHPIQFHCFIWVWFVPTPTFVLIKSIIYTYVTYLLWWCWILQILCALCGDLNHFIVSVVGRRSLKTVARMGKLISVPRAIEIHRMKSRIKNIIQNYRYYGMQQSHFLSSATGNIFLDFLKFIFLRLFVIRASSCYRPYSVNNRMAVGWKITQTNVFEIVPFLFVLWPSATHTHMQ